MAGHYAYGDTFAWDFLGDGKGFPITQGFGELGPTPELQYAYRYAADYGWPAGTHIALDIGTPAGTKVEAIEGGTVEYAGWTGFFRPYPVAVREDDGDLAIYGHLGSNDVRAGERVKAGDKLGTTLYETDANLNPTSGAHLHLEIRRPMGGGEVAIDPYDELTGAGSTPGKGGTSGGGSSGGASSGGGSFSLTGWLGRGAGLMAGLLVAALGLVAIVGTDGIVRAGAAVASGGATEAARKVASA